MNVGSASYHAPFWLFWNERARWQRSRDNTPRFWRFCVCFVTNLFSSHLRRKIKRAGGKYTQFSASVTTFSNLACTLYCFVFPLFSVFLCFAASRLSEIKRMVTRARTNKETAVCVHMSKQRFRIRKCSKLLISRDAPYPSKKIEAPCASTATQHQVKKRLLATPTVRTFLRMNLFQTGLCNKVESKARSVKY